MHRAAPHALLALLGMLLSARGARAVPRIADGLYRTGGILRQAQAGATPVLRGTRHEFAVLGARITPTRAVLWSESNQNDRYQLFVVYPLGHCAEVALALGGTVSLSEGFGSDSTGCDAGFELDQATATAAAQALHLARQDRRPVAEAVAGSFAYAQGEVVLTLRNPAGAPPVLRRQGGRNRGPRDNQFSFTVTRNGAAVTPLEGMDFGGLSGMSALAPGASAELRAPLSAWADVSARGHYVVQCSYATEFAPAGANTSDDAQRGAVWDRTFTGRVEFDVR